jgi:hypothetical protein
MQHSPAPVRQIQRLHKVTARLLPSDHPQLLELADELDMSPDQLAGQALTQWLAHQRQQARDAGQPRR